MSVIYDQRTAAREDADLMAADLGRVAGLLEEVATVWRRAGIYGQQPPSSSPASLLGAARRLADVVRALPDAHAEDHSALAISAAAQLAALENDAARSAAVTGSRQLGDAGMWAVIQGALDRIRTELWSLICHLAEIGAASTAQDVPADRDALTAPESQAPARTPPASAGEWKRALATQRRAIDALPEVELRRLLGLIGGMDPVALQRAAATYTDTFHAVAEMKGSVAALQPVADHQSQTEAADSSGDCSLRAADPASASAPGRPRRRPGRLRK